MTKLLPVVTEQTIKQVVAEAIEDKNRLFQAMAIFNPRLYQLVYGVYKLSDTNNDTMLGIIVGMYHMLERQVQIDGLLDTDEAK